MLRKDFTVARQTCATPGSWAPTPSCSSSPRSTESELARPSTTWPPSSASTRSSRSTTSPSSSVALDVGATLVGVNQRDLVTFEVDQRRAVRMARRIPDGVVKVAESGVRGADDARALHDAGYHAVLVGEALVTAADPVRAVRELKGGP